MSNYYAINKFLAPATREDSLRLLNSIYYTMIEKLVERVIDVTQLDEDRADALRKCMLRPMNYVIVEDSGPKIYSDD
jgi:hypothetical protein